MLTRVRFESSAKTKDEVTDELLGGIALIRTADGGEWEIEGGVAEIQSAKDGYWGRITMKRSTNNG